MSVQGDGVALGGSRERGVPCRRGVLRPEGGVVQEALGGGVGDGGGGTAVEMMMELGSAGWVVVGMRMLGWWRIWLRMRWGWWEIGRAHV